jgi:hypothetical protein
MYRTAQTNPDILIKPLPQFSVFQTGLENQQVLNMKLSTFMLSFPLISF